MNRGCSACGWGKQPGFFANCMHPDGPQEKEMQQVEVHKHEPDDWSRALTEVLEIVDRFKGVAKETFGSEGAVLFEEMRDEIVELGR